MDLYAWQCEDCGRVGAWVPDPGDARCEGRFHEDAHVDKNDRLTHHAKVVGYDGVRYGYVS